MVSYYCKWQPETERSDRITLHLIRSLRSAPFPAAIVNLRRAFFMSQFKSICPHCFMHYTLDIAYLGKTAQCSNCRETFQLERVSETLALASDLENEQNLDGTDSENSNEPQSVVKSLFTLPQEQTRRSLPSTSQSQPGQLTETFPASASESSGEFSGIWSVGEVVLGIYEVKPIAADIPYAQGGVALLIEVLTDNKNRAAADCRADDSHYRRRARRAARPRERR